MVVAERHGIGGQEQTARRNRHLRDLAIGGRAHHHQAVLGGAARNREAPGLAGRRQVGEVGAHAGFVANRHARLVAAAAILAQPVDHAAVVSDRERGKGGRPRRALRFRFAVMSDSRFRVTRTQLVPVVAFDGRAWLAR